MENNNFLEAAKRRFPGHVVGGSGRWALYTPCAGPMGKILLFENRADAAAQILDPKRVQIVDLLALPVSTCKTVADFYDPDELRRERRERRNA
jgi:hypothetical protein